MCRTLCASGLALKQCTRRPRMRGDAPLLLSCSWPPTLCREPQTEEEGHQRIPLLEPGLKMTAANGTEIPNVGCKIVEFFGSERVFPLLGGTGGKT